MNEPSIMLTIDMMNDKIGKLRPGDVVEIPPNEEEECATIAIVRKIYKNTVRFERPNGTMFMLGYFDAYHTRVIHKADFHEYNEDMAMEDIKEALSERS